MSEPKPSVHPSPRQPKLALQTRLRDRFYDLYVHLPMLKVVGE